MSGYIDSAVNAAGRGEMASRFECWFVASTFFFPMFRGVNRHRYCSFVTLFMASLYFEMRAQVRFRDVQVTAALSSQCLSSETVESGCCLPSPASSFGIIDVRSRLVMFIRLVDSLSRTKRLRCPLSIPCPIAFTGLRVRVLWPSRIVRRWDCPGG